MAKAPVNRVKSVIKEIPEVEERPSNQSKTVFLKNTRFMPVLLYRDDIEAIYSRCSEYRPKPLVATRKKKFRDIEAFFKHFHLFDGYLYIHHPPDYEIEFTPTKTHLIASGDEVESARLFYEIQEILKSAQRKMAYVFHPAAWFYIAVFGAMFSKYIYDNATYSRLSKAGLIATIMLVSCGGLIKAVKLYMNGHATILRHKRDEKPSFWKRKGDDVIMWAFGLFSGLLIAFGTMVAKEKFFPSTLDKGVVPVAAPSVATDDGKSKLGK